MRKVFLSSIFSDETPLFRNPMEPNPGDSVSIRIRTGRGGAAKATLVETDSGVHTPMKRVSQDSFFDYFETTLVCSEKPLAYSFLVESYGEWAVCQKNGVFAVGAGHKPDPHWAFRFTPGFHVPQWSRGAIQYQIFVDRFCNGNTENDVSTGEYYYVNGHSRHLEWNDPITGVEDIRSFYGGDLEGVAQKLDYLQNLGIDLIYFNPIFVSPSSHKYDTQDYEHIDPHLAVVTRDDPHEMLGWEKHNAFAAQYICRVASVKNLEDSDAYFAKFCQMVHARGMRIMLDGVFNHCGSYNKWLDREGIYVGMPGFHKGAYQDENSPFRSYFSFKESGKAHAKYEGWWDFVTLPKLNYEGSPELREKIMAVGEKWAAPPYSIDGWRLDVAADLGHSSEYNHDFWREFRRRVKAVNPELVIIAEHYGDASAWLQGDQWDSVMNYDAFMEPVTYFLTGMEKHSDGFQHELYQNGEAFFRMMRDNMARLQEPSIACAMNELSNHDHSRFLTRTNKRIGRLNSVGGAAAGENVDKAVLREAAVIQMTWPGAPTLYYGDEAGVVGWTDPDCRRTYPWGHEDQELISLHRELIGIRKRYPVLNGGSVKQVAASYGFICYARFDSDDCILVLVNNSGDSREEILYLNTLGIPEESHFSCIFRSDRSGHSCPGSAVGPVVRGTLSVAMEPQSTLILRKIRSFRF